MLHTFWVIIFVQLVIFLFFYFRNRGTRRDGIKVLLLSACAGLIGGFLFDVILGLLGVFSYHSFGSGKSFSRTGLSLWQLIVNGIFSYGLAFATASYITPKKELFTHTFYKKSTILSLCLLAFTSVTFLSVLPFGVISLFLSGVCIIAVGECMVLLRGISGPLLSLVFSRKYTSLILLWADIVFIGFFYELANYFFPFWIWLPNFDFSRPLLEGMIIIFGYVALFHPMIIFWQRVTLKK